MANELTINCTIAYAKNNTTVSDSVTNLQITVVGNGLNSLTAQTVGTSAAVIPLGSVTSAGGWLYVQNTDATNYLQLKTATGGTVFGQIKAGEVALIRLDPTVTAPAWIANTAPVVVKFAIFDA